MGLDKVVLKKGLKEPTHVKNIISIRCKCHTKVGNLHAKVLRSKEPIPFKELHNFESQFVPILKWQKWASKFGCAWFHFTGKVPKKAIGKHLVCRLKLQGEGLVFNKDGYVLQGVTQVLSKGDVFHSMMGKQVIDISRNTVGDEEIDFLVDAGFNGKLRFEHLVARLRRFDICIEHDDIIQYYYDYIDLFFLMMKLDTNSDRYKELDKILLESYKLFKKKGAQAARDHITPFQYKEGDYPKTKLYSIGHAHIDLAWLWPIRETKRKVARTFGNQLRNIDIYDDFIFAESQPQMFTWLKEDYPDLFEKVKKQVEAGRIELQGGNWVEGDCNLTSGESWVRQAMYGKKYWKEEFNFDSKMCWLPDVFGFPASLPQVLKKCGMDYFMTIKLISNTVNQFPYKSFNWVGLDGTSILAHMEPAGDYNSGATAFALYKSNVRNTERDILDKALLIYGDGDGGGGPGEGHIEFVKRHKTCKMSKAIDFFHDMEEDKNILPTHNGELYYERHQGCYTSQAASKKWNRRMEEMLHKVEWLGAFAHLKGISYDREKVEQIWKETLLYQFHDVLPGSAIKRVYDESKARYAIMYNELCEIESKLREQLSNTPGICAINPVGFNRDEYIKIDNDWYKAKVNGYSSSTMTLATIDENILKYSDNTIENDKLIITFNNKNGNIISLYDKENNIELVKDYFNKLVVYSDPFMFYNAWDIDMNYQNMKKWEPKLTGIKTYIDGPTIIRESSYKYNKSTIVQKVILTIGDGMARFDTVVDWHEKLKMLRADFVPTIFADKVKCNIQFGNYDRTTHEDNSVEKAQFEVCAHKFINLDQDNYGWALLNDCKYGHRVKNGFVSIALLRAPKFPDPTCDRGTNTFTYAIYPHKNNYENSDVLSKGYCLNNKIEVTKESLEINPIITSDKNNIIIETIKVAENNDGIIARIYESNGVKTSTKLTTCNDFTETFETDMLENVVNKVNINKLVFAPYEIKTILLKK